MDDRPLAGVRVVDLTRLLPGAFCSLVLADLGADVVKVEEPHVGDAMRTIPPFANGTSVYFHALNRNKRSITLDLRQRAAAAVLDRVVSSADVVVESFRPHTSRRLGVSGANLLARHPRLVHCAITGFGQSGPYAERPAHDLNFVALSGLFEVDQAAAMRPGARLAGDRPEVGALRVPGLLVADIGGAWAAVAGICAALFQRERTGRGSSVDISIHDVALSWLTFPAAARMIGTGGERTTRSAPTAAEPPPFPITSDEACYNIYTTSDGRHVALAAIEQKFWQTFCERTGHPEFIGQQFVPGVQERLRRDVAAVFRSRTLADWLALFADAEVCLTPINTIHDALADDHFHRRGSVVEQHGNRYIRTPIVFDDAKSADPSALEQPASGSRAPRIRPARPLGADTETVLREAGLGDDELRVLRQQQVI